MAKIRNKQPDADAGRVIVDEQLEDLEARLTSMYAQTAKEVQSDLDKFLSKYKAEDAKKQAMVEADEMTKDEYIDWRNRQIFRSNAMRAKIDDVTARMVNTDKQAMSMVNDQLPETYATSYNFGGYRAEAMSHQAGFDYTQFTIINQDAVKELATKDPDLIPWKADPDVEEDKRWNRQHIQEAVRQGIVKGDSMDDIAKRLLPIVNMDKNAAIRTARTAVNGIENKGRKDATERVKAAGIPMIEMWSCTHDNRTRDTHILLDKTLPNEKGLFGEGILTTLLEYPGDPSGDPAEVYNCRCGLMSTIKGIDHSKDDELYAKMMEEEYYDDWLQVKEKQDEKEAAFQTKKEGAAERVAAKQARKAEKLPDVSELLPAEDLTSGKRGVVQGKDISGTWERRADKFEFAIDDVIDAQGFNGLPKIVSEEEFEKAVKESNFIAQRSYSAQNQDVLDSYRDQLYNGDWYVDCSTGGAQYGQGMYCASDYTGTLSDGIKEEMKHYREVGESRFSGSDAVSYTETFTLTPDAKIITYNDLYNMKLEMQAEIRNKYVDGALTDVLETKGLGDNKAAKTFIDFQTGTNDVSWDDASKAYSELVEQGKLDDVNALLSDANKAKQDALTKGNEEWQEYDNKYGDLGVLAVSKGYDAINAEGHGVSESYTVILNRSKVIIKEDKDNGKT